MKIAPSDLVEISIGGNDARGYYMAGGSLAGVNASATTAANAATTGLNSLVAAGARTIVWTAGDVSALPESAAFSASAVAVGSAYSQNFNAQMQAALANIARSGVRVEYIDNGLLGKEIVANPARYGFTSVGVCPIATCIGTTAAAQAIQRPVSVLRRRHPSDLAWLRHPRRIHRQPPRCAAHLCAAGRSRR